MKKGFHLSEETKQKMSNSKKGISYSKKIGAPIKPKHRPNALKEHKKCEEDLISMGFNVFKNGWPDFLCEMNGVVTIVEAKSPKDKIKPHQKKVIDLLKKYKICCLLYQHGGFKYL